MRKSVHAGLAHALGTGILFMAATPAMAGAAEAGPHVTARFGGSITSELGESNTWKRRCEG